MALVMLGWSVHLITLFHGQATSTSCTYSESLLIKTTKSLESAEGEKWPYKLFHDQSSPKNVIGSRLKCDPWNCSRTHYGTSIKFLGLNQSNVGNKK